MKIIVFHILFIKGFFAMFMVFATNFGGVCLQITTDYWLSYWIKNSYSTPVQPTGPYVSLNLKTIYDMILYRIVLSCTNPRFDYSIHSFFHLFVHSFIYSRGLVCFYRTLENSNISQSMLKLLSHLKLFFDKSTGDISRGIDNTVYLT